jgi:hypothetical protein
MSSGKDRLLYHRSYKQNGDKARFGAMQSVVNSPTVEPRDSSDREDLFFLRLFLCYGNSASSAAAPLETELFGVDTRVERLGFYSSQANYRVL